MNQAQCTAAQKQKRGSNEPNDQASSVCRLIPSSSGKRHRNVMFISVILYLIDYTTSLAFLGGLVFMKNMIEE